MSSIRVHDSFQVPGVGLGRSLKMLSKVKCSFSTVDLADRVAWKATFLCHDLLDAGGMTSSSPSSSEKDAFQSGASSGTVALFPTYCESFLLIQRGLALGINLLQVEQQACFIIHVLRQDA